MMTKMYSVPEQSAALFQVWATEHQMGVGELVQGLTKLARAEGRPSPLFITERDPSSGRTFIEVNCAAGLIDPAESVVCLSMANRCRWRPGLCISLTGSHATCFERVKARARASEGAVSEDYLRALLLAYQARQAQNTGSSRITICTDAKDQTRVYNEAIEVCTSIRSVAFIFVIYFRRGGRFVSDPSPSTLLLDPSSSRRSWPSPLKTTIWIQSEPRPQLH